MQHITHNLFPSNVMTFDCSDRFRLDEVNEMISCNDRIIETKNGYNVPSPSHQSNPILFTDPYLPVYGKVNTLFKELCFKYINDNIPNRAFELAGTSAWFYKGYRSLNQQQTNPVHNHTPAFLAGVFYLKIPDAPGGGTTFWGRCNSGITTSVTIKVPELCFSIFPGWLDHCTEYSDTEDPRHVIAANYYVREI